MSSCKLTVMGNRTVPEMNFHWLQSNCTVTDSRAECTTGAVFWQRCSLFLFFALHFYKSGGRVTWKSQTDRDSRRSSERWPCRLTQALTSPRTFSSTNSDVCKGSRPSFPLTKRRSAEDLWKATFGASEVLFCCFPPPTTDHLCR